MKSKGFAFLVASLFAGAVAVAACGSSDSSTSAATAVTAPATTGSNTTASTATGNGGASTTTGTSTGGSSSSGTPSSICAAIDVGAVDMGSGGDCTAVMSDGGASDGGANLGCASCCTTEFPHGYLRFQCLQLEECGCAKNAPCATACTAECANPASINMEDAGAGCATCLLDEAGKGFGSNCTVQTATGDCPSDDHCTPFGTCAIGCATQ